MYFIQLEEHLLDHFLRNKSYQLAEYLYCIFVHTTQMIIVILMCVCYEMVSKQ
jgi:hypothetical protein